MWELFIHKLGLNSIKILSWKDIGMLENRKKVLSTGICEGKIKYKKKVALERFISTLDHIWKFVSNP